MQTATSTSSNDAAPPKRVSVLLGLGIFLIPPLFVWALLGKSYSWRARAVGFAWLALALIVFALGPPGGGQANETPTTATAAQGAVTANSEASRAEAQAAFLQTHARFMQWVEQCDTAWAPVQQALSVNNHYDAYRAARRGSDACRDASLGLRDIRFTVPANEQERRTLNQTVRDCSIAMAGEQMAMDRGAEVFNGDLRPSSVERFTSTAQQALREAELCVARYVAAAVGAGFELPET
jgi:hypothetical protein